MASPCDTCRWYSYAHVNEHWHGHICLAPDYQHEMRRKKPMGEGAEPRRACGHHVPEEVDTRCD